MSGMIKCRRSQFEELKRLLESNIFDRDGVIHGNSI